MDINQEHVKLVAKLNGATIADDKAAELAADLRELAGVLFAPLWAISREIHKQNTILERIADVLEDR